MEKVWFYCPNCEEEYNLPEDSEICPICQKKDVELV